MQECTINFQNRDQANKFKTAWAFKSKMGHIIKGSSVTVWNVTDELKVWIDAYVLQLNYSLSDINDFESMSDNELLNALGV